MPDPKPDDVDFHEETTDPLVADLRNFYKVEKWTRDGMKVDSLLYAGNNLDKARDRRGVYCHALCCRLHEGRCGKPNNVGDHPPGLIAKN